MRMPTREEDRETIARQQQKARESALRYENIVTTSDREAEMVAIIRQCMAEAARGNLKSHLLRLIQLRSYGSHNGEDNWLRTLTAFKKGFFLKVHPDKFGEFNNRGENILSSSTMGFAWSAPRSMSSQLSRQKSSLLWDSLRQGNFQYTCRRRLHLMVGGPKPALHQPPIGPRKRMLHQGIGVHGHGAVRISCTRTFP